MRASIRYVCWGVYKNVTIYLKGIFIHPLVSCRGICIHVYMKTVCSEHISSMSSVCVLVMGGLYVMILCASDVVLESGVMYWCACVYVCL